MKHLWLFVLFLAAASASAQAECLDYAQKATLEGVISAADVPGPPNYESIADGDRAEHDLYIELASPICMLADSRAQMADFNVEIAAISKIQITANPELYAKARTLVGQKARVSGELFGMMLAHHHTPVLIDVDSVAASK